MKLPKKIDIWDWRETHMVPNGYDMETRPQLSQRNFEILAERYNDLIDFLEEKFPRPEEDDDS